MFSKRIFILFALAFVVGVSSAQSVGGTFTDERDGKTYRTVSMPDGKTWMAENLNFETERGSWCYDDDESNCDVYGRLYDWNTAMAGAASSGRNPSRVQGVCPAGWHLPSDREWEELIRAVGDRRTALIKLKSSNGWSENGNGTDDFAFSALPSGGRNSEGVFGLIGLNGYWWTSTERNVTDAHLRLMQHNRNHLLESSSWGSKDNGFSVRCVRD